MGKTVDAPNSEESPQISFEPKTLALIIREPLGLRPLKPFSWTLAYDFIPRPNVTAKLTTAMSETATEILDQEFQEHVEKLKAKFYERVLRPLGEAILNQADRKLNPYKYGWERQWARIRTKNLRLSKK